MPTSIELFAGAGGLALGLTQAGFKHAAVVEWDRASCDTIRANKARGQALVRDWPVHELDVAKFDYRPLPSVDLVAGGPPCQPWSVGGKHQGFRDERDMFPQAVRAVRELAPRAFMFENVRGLLRESFARYFEYIVLQLSYPGLLRRASEPWESHVARLEQVHTRGQRRGLVYNVVFSVLNAADFGVPQHRFRVFIVGFRQDLGQPWSFPTPTHSHDALLCSQWVTGDYWERHQIARRARPEMPARVAARVERLKAQLMPVVGEPWHTVRDAIHDLPDPTGAKNGAQVANHEFNPGARTYIGHTGSPLDEPAKTLKAGDHGVPGGENMLAMPDGGVRYFTVRESARLQTFPDDYYFPVTWTESMRQLGNAVPVRLGETVARSVGQVLGARVN